MLKNYLKNWKPGPLDIVILVGAITNLIVIGAILVWYFIYR